VVGREAETRTRSRRTRIASNVSSSGRNLRCFGLAARRFAAVAGAVVAGLTPDSNQVFIPGISMA